MVRSTYVNSQLNAVMHEQAKDADRLEPKGNVVGTGAEVSSVMGIQHHRREERAYPVYRVSLAKHGKPVIPLKGKASCKAN